MFRIRFGAACVLVMLTACSHDLLAAVDRIEILERLPYAEGREFAGIGPYERLLGRVHFSVDPRARANSRIVDLGLAPKNDRGRVVYRADFEILAPVDLSKANGALLYDVNNRGRRACLNYFNTGADQFLMRKGYVVVWSGWIGELLPGGDRLRLDAPVARNGDHITGTVRAELVTDKPDTRMLINGAAHGAYPPTPAGLSSATLTWRLRESDPRRPIPREQWHIETQPVDVDGELPSLPKVELVMPGGFIPGYIYELIYEAQQPIVQGLGLAGIRDLVAFLKYDSTHGNPLRRADGNPVAQLAMGWGISQSGRCLRMLLYDGLNADEKGRIVFDGMMPHVAGGGLGFFNHRFASPTRFSTQHGDHLYPTDVFPFTYGVEDDPFTNRREGILDRCRASGTVPKIMHTQTSAEYWNRAGSLVHTDPGGTRDSQLPREVRIYAFGGAQHGAGSGGPGSVVSGQLPANPTDYRPLLRGLLIALDQWIRDDIEPPPSRFPRISERTLLSWEQGPSGWHPLPGVRYPDVIHEPSFLDYGDGFSTTRQITQHPPQIRDQYRVLVPGYDADNNERGMLRLPSIEVPVATFTGWNHRNPKTGAEAELTRLNGSYIPFPRTMSERSESGDPRPAVQERYRDYADYLARIRAATEELIAERYLLEEALPRLLELAESNRALFER